MKRFISEQDKAVDRETAVRQTDRSGGAGNVVAISELIEYYKGIFTTLSSCASRQLEEVTFRRATISVPELMATAGKYFRKVYKGNKAHIDFKIQPLEGRITGDWNQLRFLLENLIDEACSVTLDGAVCLSAREDGEFYTFSVYRYAQGKDP